MAATFQDAVSLKHYTDKERLLDRCIMSPDLFPKRCMQRTVSKFMHGDIHSILTWKLLESLRYNIYLTVQEWHVHEQCPIIREFLQDISASDGAIYVRLGQASMMAQVLEEMEKEAGLRQDPEQIFWRCGWNDRTASTVACILNKWIPGRYISADEVFSELYTVMENVLTRCYASS